MALIVSDKVLPLLEVMRDYRADHSSPCRSHLQVGQVPVIYVERYGDERLLHLAEQMKGVEVKLIDPVTQSS